MGNATLLSISSAGEGQLKNENSPTVKTSSKNLEFAIWFLTLGVFGVRNDMQTFKSEL